MLPLSSFQKDLVSTGKATPTGTLPPAQKQQVDPMLELDKISQPVQPPPPQEQSSSGFSWGEHYKKLVAPTVGGAKAVGNFFTSSEQKLGGIIGDTVAANSGVQDTLTKNNMQQMDMFRRVQQQISQNKAQGKDTSDLEWVLSQARSEKISPQQEMAGIAPGSQATNEEALGAVGGVALDVLTAGTYAAPGTVASRTVKATATGEKGAGEIFKYGMKQGLKAAPVGAAYGAASAMQENEGVGGVLGSAAIGAGVAGSLPLLAGGATAIKQSFRPTTEKAMKDYRGQIENLFGRTQTSRKALAKSESFGKSPVDLLSSKAQHGDIVPISVEKRGDTQVWNTKDAVQKLSDDVANLRETIYKPILSQSPERIALDTLGQRAKAKIKSKMGGSADYQKAVSQIDDAIRGLKQAPEYQSGAIRLDQLDDIKSDYWGKSKTLFAKQQPEFSSSADFQLAEAAKEIIEERLPDEASVKLFNQFIGQHLQAIEQLQKIDESIVKNGKMGKNFMRTIGAIAGGSSGGTGGAIAGAMAGDQLSSVLGEFAGNNPYTMKALEGVAKTNPALINQLNDFVPGFVSSSAGKVKVPGKATQGFGVVDLSGGKPVNLRNTKTSLGIQDVLKKQAVDAAEQEARWQERLNKPRTYSGGGPRLEKEIPPNKRMMLAAAPFGIEQDENGEMTYNPEKAAIGILAMGAIGKMTPAKRDALLAHKDLLNQKWSNTTNKTARKQIEKAIQKIVKSLN